ncbi:amidohydrolase [Albimonas sp. CAU 1670]|uniref:amidohydrolase n=1 Tax=Albimonas sp. CAU 1670 TaxID=3032599 RepID=UPI0023DA2190|nr:amidohydrolase [Albimonas sp. CAU 1670]MDF2233725.1 amidohydrolase [Albimonas sp. CAU 1670]
MTPDLVILNGRLITMDPARPRASALAIAAGVIVAVGETAEIRGLAGPATRVVDAGGATVLPGFIDSHVHLFQGAIELDYLDLYGTEGIEALTAKVRPYAEANPTDAVVFAIQGDYSILGPRRHTTRQDLDQVLPDRPFAMFAPDHHTVWANTKALELAGLLHGGETDMGSEIMMAPDGTATGELREPGAYAPILSHTRYGGRDMFGLVTGADPVPAPTAEERAIDAKVMARGLKHAASHGITGLHNMDGNFYTAELLKACEEAGDLLCRTEVPFHYKSFDSLDRFEEAEEMRRRFTGDWVWSNRVKMFMDGVVESSTALMIEPYPGLETTGDAVFEPEHFNAACIKADGLGFQIAVHAIGDLAVRRTLDGYQAAREANGVRDSRHRIEHIEVLDPADLPRFVELGVVASIQPGHAPFGGVFPPDGAGKMLHERQIPWSYAWRRIRDSGARVIFSTDWPVMPVDVTTNLKAAVAPMDLGSPWADNTQTLMETLESYTAGNAWIEFNEARKGRLAPGMMADVAVMSHDLEALPPSEIDRARAALTICGGRVTWEA